MPIFDQGYQRWHGRFRGRAWRCWAVTWQGVKTQFKGRWIKLLLGVSIMPALCLVAFLVFWSLLEQQAPIIQPLLGLLQGLPEEVRQGPKNYRVMMWTLAFNFFFMVQLFFSMVLVLIVGPDLISKDLRFNALPLYLSRPLRRVDYFVGKLGVIAFYLALVTTGPVLLAYTLGVAFSLDPAIIQDTWHILVGAVVWSLVVMVSAGTLMLAISSLSRNSRYVSILFAAFWLVLSIASGSVWSALPRNQDQTRPDWPRVISYTNNLWRIGEVCINTAAAWEQWDRLMEALEKRTAAAQAGLPPGMRRSPSGRTPQIRVGAQPGQPTMRAQERQTLRQTFPWWWSAATLGGLFACSVLILTSRVRSLDRLK